MSISIAVEFTILFTVEFNRVEDKLYNAELEFDKFRGVLFSGYSEFSGDPNGRLKWDITTHTNSHKTW